MAAITALHTPGPFELGGEIWIEQEGYHTAGGQRYREIGSVKQGSVLALVLDDDCDEECVGNANLFAAAPALLEACEWALGTIRGNSYGLSPGEVAAALEMAAKGCEEAIAKAKGAS